MRRSTLPARLPQRRKRLRVYIIIDHRALHFRSRFRTIAIRFQFDSKTLTVAHACGWVGGLLIARATVWLRTSWLVFEPTVLQVSHAMVEDGLPACPAYRSAQCPSDTTWT